MGADRTAILAEISEMLQAILKDVDPDVEITTSTTFRDELEMESIDIVSLAGRLQARYGNTVNFAQFVANLDLTSVSELRVGQLVEHIAVSLENRERADAEGSAFAEVEAVGS